jgi:prefoldin subunit 5
MSTINERLQTAKRALMSAPSYRFAIEVIEDNGSIKYRNKATGRVLGNLEDAFSSVDTLGLVDFRIFSSSTVEAPFNNFAETRGANQLASEIKVVNDFLRAAGQDPTSKQMQTLKDIGLERLAGTTIGGKFYKANTGGRPDVIEAINKTLKPEEMASISVTDEGYSLLQYYSESGVALSGKEARVLQSAVGVSPIQKDFLIKMLKTDKWSDISKMAKRLQSYMSPRDLALGEQFIASFLDTQSTSFQDTALRIDRRAGVFELMFGEATSGRYDLTPQEEAFILGSRLRGSTTLDTRERYLRESSQKFKDSLKSVYQFQDQEIEKLTQLWEEASAEAPMYAPSSAPLTADNTLAAVKMKLFKEKVGQLDTLDPANAVLSKKFSTLFDGVEKSVDGQFIITKQFLEDIKTPFEAEISRLKSGSGVIDEATAANIDALQKQLDSINVALSKLKNNDDIITRINLGFGQFKGEAMVVGDKIARNFTLSDGTIPRVIADLSAIKGEVGSDIVRNILMNIGEGGTEVFSDPLMFLSHSSYFTNPQMLKLMQQNAAASISKSNEFMNAATASEARGLIPKAVLEEIEKEAVSPFARSRFFSTARINAGISYEEDG